MTKVTRPSEYSPRDVQREEDARSRLQDQATRSEPRVRRRSQESNIYYPIRTIRFPMPSILHPALRRLLGGETRARVLGLLADSTVPKTGYELAKAARANPSKVYAILRDLAELGLVKTTSNRPGVRQYSLADPDLRRFLLRNVRITTIEEWFSPARVQAREVTLGHLKPTRFEIWSSHTRRQRLPNYREFERPPEKDRALRRIARRHASRE